MAQTVSCKNSPLQFRKSLSPTVPAEELPTASIFLWTHQILRSSNDTRQARRLQLSGAFSELAWDTVTLLGPFSGGQPQKERVVFVSFSADEGDGSH